jgi:hypothetical protein
MTSLAFIVAVVAAPPKTDLEFFEKKIRPVLVAQCYECHSAKSKIVQANLYLDTREGTLRGGDSGPAVVPGEPEKSLLIEALRYEGYEMPPKGKLSDAVIADFVKWIETGAADPRDGAAQTVKTIDVAEGRKFWSYQPPRLTPPPSLQNPAWPRNEIDRYVLARLEAAGLRPVADADRGRLIRRLSFDLVGLPPTPEEAAAFEVDDSPQAVERVVDRLLASPHFGERWGRHWLDVARYGESSGLERNVPYRLAWRYRDYVYDAFNADLPYDEFIREQLAGDLLPSSTVAERDRRLTATGFLAIGTRALTERVEEQFLMDVVDEQLDATCRTFLASSVACARCHDHKFDPIPTTDYYALAGIFRSTESLAGVRPLRREFSYSLVSLLGDEGRQASTRALVDRIAQLQKEIDQANNDLRAAYKTKDLKQAEAVKDRIRAVNEAMVAALAETEGAADAGPRFAMSVRDREQPVDCAVRIRGDVDQLGPVVPRGFLSVAADEPSPKPATGGSGRRELAEWIASRDNPLTARVMVNRLWQHLFGRGLVESCDNFGLTGEKPTHPELLDYLAIRFMDEGWSVKRAIREMVLSRTYQLSDRRDEAAFAVDADNRLLWRFAPRRLEAEAIRDALLAVAGRLNLERPYGSASLKLTNLELGSSAKSLALDDTPQHRAAYLPMLRGNVPEMLGLFDAADPSLVIGRRDVTSVATQSLYLMNGKFAADQSRRFAERVFAHTADEGARIDAAYRLALARDPDDFERRRVLEFLRFEQDEGGRSELDAWTGVCQALFGTAEFFYLR